MNDRPTLVMKRRNFLVLALIGIFDGVLMGRLATIQAVDGEHLKRIADSAHFRGVPLAAFRGNIVDRYGHLLAGSHHAYSTYAIPIQTRRHRSRESVLLATMLSVPENKIMRRLSRRQGFVWLKRRLTSSELDAMKSQSAALPGVYLVTETARYYPEGNLAGPVLGFTGIDNQGLAGVELVYNQYLEGKPGKIQEEYDVTGRTIQFARQRVIQPVQGDTVELTLDEKIQWMAERACEQAMITTGAKSVSITVMHPPTGGILALAQRPTFNPNRYREVDPSRYRVLVVSDAIPPGSIFKPVTLASALDMGTTHRGAGFYCPGFKRVLGRRVNCWRPEGHGAESLGQVVKNSCNVGFMELGLGLGVSRFYEALNRFGLMGPTTLDLPGRARGIYPKMSAVTALDLAIMAFGQTLTVSPIGLLNAISAIANDGVLLKPHIARLIRSPQGKLVKAYDTAVLRRVIAPNVSRQVQDMLVSVVSEGTGKLGQVPGFRVAGKTGTAQKVINGRTEKGIYIASFVGFGPVPNPEVAIMINVDEPQGAFYGGQVAAPIFSRLTRDIFRHLNLAPTEPVKPPKNGEPALVPNLVNLNPLNALDDAEAFGFPVQFVGHGDVVVNQSIQYGAWLPAGTRITLTLGPDTRIYLEWVAVPNFVGLKPHAADQVAFELGLNVRWVSGQNGAVREQSIHPGTEVRAGTTVMVS